MSYVLLNSSVLALIISFDHRKPDFQFLKRHLEQWCQADPPNPFRAMCLNGPRKDIRPHLFISTFIHQNFEEKNLGGILIVASVFCNFS